MPNLLTQLTKDAQARFLEELNYLNLAEIRGFCSDRGIPYKILAEYPDGEMKVTKDVDRKPIVLARVRHYLATGMVGPPTCIPAEIVRHDNPPSKPGPGDRLLPAAAIEHSAVAVAHDSDISTAIGAVSKLGGIDP